MTIYIVTVQLKKNPNHNLKNKKTAACPVAPEYNCTDSTGEYHSFLHSQEDDDEIPYDVDEIALLYMQEGYHVTRVEVGSLGTYIE